VKNTQDGTRIYREFQQAAVRRVCCFAHLHVGGISVLSFTQTKAEGTDSGSVFHQYFFCANTQRDTRPAIMFPYVAWLPASRFLCSVDFFLPAAGIRC